MILVMDGKEEKNTGETKKTIEAISQKLGEMLKTDKFTRGKE